MTTHDIRHKVAAAAAEKGGYSVFSTDLAMYPRTQQISAFLGALYANYEQGWLEVRLLHSDQPARKLWRRLPLAEVNSAGIDNLSMLNAQGWNVCFRVGVSQKQRSLKSDITSIPAVWVDTDDNSMASWMRIQSHLPTITVSSGSGYHAYWIFDKAYEINSTADMERFERLASGLAKSCNGDKACTDVGRIMRMPYFNNMKAKYGPTGKLVEIDGSISARRYRFEALEVLFSEAPVARVRRDVPVWEPDGSLPKQVRDYLQYGAAQGSRAVTLLKIASILRNMGYTQGQAESMLSGRANADGLKDKEINQQIRSAYRYPVSGGSSLPGHLAAVCGVEDNKNEF